MTLSIMSEQFKKKKKCSENIEKYGKIHKNAKLEFQI